ncbi:uncharacterized protein HMPREF1541_03164 [Cyphellophora europaea CBS 101466]|uniref:Rhamnolipids biosynthesis 3-oxoacyl-[acyl-carrier-protein] reductase n=1 Tax=Cyphellophora europaea (strain CBS 101466) TaxID=1220924 RepID=W2RZV4_CYPE1|nr:uncharacterized protein HMPREF1541_03164 [Cyphellophora europaea CBS 101466]ETN41229.1 hypothetical protein HMPREF1541_03164 [Cyphellophora europaea CBS 101466]
MSDIPPIQTLFDLSGKTALITGGSRGLGLHTATALLLAGASLTILVSRKSGGEHGLDQAVTRLNALPGVRGRAIGIPSNVADTKEIEKLVTQVSEILAKDGKRGLDILVCNAGATWGGPFEPTPDWSSQKILDLNVRGVFNLCRLFIPLLTLTATPSDPSRIITVSSVAATTVPHTGSSGTIMYAASKAAASHLTRQLAVELAPRHVTCNTVSPGFFPSKLANGLIEILGGEEEVGRKGNPRGRLGRAEDIGAVMVWLCGKGGGYINGVEIEVDGGSRWARHGGDGAMGGPKL